MTVFIYCLSDPETHEIRYVGKAIDVRARLSSHLGDKKSSHKSHWIKSLLSRGLKPELEILESFFESNDLDWQESERWWISYLRFIGCKLTNYDSGGRSGMRHPPPTIEKIKASAIGNQRAKGIKRTSEQRKAVSNAQKGVPESKATREKNRLAHLGKKHSESARQKCRIAGLKRKPHSPATIRLFSDNAKAQWARKRNGESRAIGRRNQH